MITIRPHHDGVMLEIRTLAWTVQHALNREDAIAMAHRILAIVVLAEDGVLPKERRPAKPVGECRFGLLELGEPGELIELLPEASAQTSLAGLEAE